MRFAPCSLILFTISVGSSAFGEGMAADLPAVNHDYDDAQGQHGGSRGSLRVARLRMPSRVPVGVQTPTPLGCVKAQGQTLAVKFERSSLTRLQHALAV